MHNVSVSDALHILFEDNHCLAVAKPAGLLTQGVPCFVVGKFGCTRHGPTIPKPLRKVSN